MKPNRLREKLKAGEATLGTHLHVAWPGIVELVGHSGMFDYVEFLGEYAPFDLFSLENIGRAIELFPHMSGMMKVDQEPRVHLACRSLGSGIQNILFADPRTVDDVKQCVRAVRAEAPGSGGIHGVGMRRDVGIVVEPGSPAFVKALDDAVVAIMIEKKEAIENLDAILAVPGVDMVQFGPADYAMSLGLAGQFDHPSVREAESFLIKRALAKGIAPRAEIRYPEQARRYLDAGVKDFCIGWDVSILFDWYKSAGRAMRDALGLATNASVAEGGYGNRK